MNRMGMLVAMLTVAACASDDTTDPVVMDPEPNFCKAPSGHYTIGLRYQTGTCIVQDGPFSFHVFAGNDGKQDAAPDVDSAGGAIDVKLVGQGCEVDVALLTLDSAGTNFVYTIALSGNSKALSSGVGKVQGIASDGRSCETPFNVSTILWTP